MAENVQTVVIPEMKNEFANQTRPDEYCGVLGEEIGALGSGVTHEIASSALEVIVEPKGAASVFEFWESLFRGEATPTVGLYGLKFCNISTIK